MGLFEEIGNLEHEKKAYDTFVKYHKDIATIENMAFFWQLYFKGNLKFDDALYDFYKERIVPLGEKGKIAMFNLEYTKKHKDEMLITYRSEITPEEKQKFRDITRCARWSRE